MTFCDRPVGATVISCPVESPARQVWWVEIELVGEDDQPIPWEEYKVVLPDGTVATGYLDQDGFARFEQIPRSGECEISFPNLDKDAWRKMAVLPMRGGAPGGGATNVAS